MMKILSIGNSFSRDAQRYLHAIADGEGVKLTCTNLYLPGCPLHVHEENLRTGGLYEVDRDGVETGERTTITEALRGDAWDVVTLQQASPLSIGIASYRPHIEILATAIREQAPTAKLYIHETWAFEQDSARLNTELGYADQHDMLRDVVAAYAEAAAVTRADGIIPCGRAMMAAIDRGVRRVHRDTFHAGLGVGRYLLGLTWFETLTGRRVERGFIPLDEPVEETVLLTVREAVEGVVFT